MKKEKIKNKLLIVIVALVTSFVTAYGVSSTFDSSNVCYKVDSNTGASVQDTIDDLYGRASDYSELNNKVSTLEGYFPSFTTSLNNTTNPYSGDGINLGKNASIDQNPWVDLYYNNAIRGSLFYAIDTDSIVLTSRNSLGARGQGTLKLEGNPVQINGVDVSNVTHGSVSGNGLTMNWFKYGRFVFIKSLSKLNISVAADGILVSNIPAAYNMGNMYFNDDANGNMVYISTADNTIRTLRARSSGDWITFSAIYLSK